MTRTNYDMSLYFLMYNLQSFTKYLRQTLVFIKTAHYGKSPISVFQEIFTSTDKMFSSGGGLGNNSLKFLDFPDISYFPKILSLKSFGNS